MRPVGGVSMVALRPSSIFIGAALWGLIVAAPSSAQTFPCVSQLTDPCVFNGSTLAVGTYDIRPRSLSIPNRNITLTGAGLIKVLANNITFTPGGRWVASGTTGNIAVDLEATGFIDIQSQGTSKSK